MTFRLSLNQQNARCLRIISAHLLGNNLHSCTRIPSSSLCSNSTSNGQFNDESTKVQNTEALGKGSRNLRKLIDWSPNESWSKETMRQYNKLRRQVDESNGLWVDLEFIDLTGEHGTPLYLSVDQNGKKMFELYQIFNKTEKHLKGVLQFGPCTMGSKGFVHGGAIAAMLDFITAALSLLFGYETVTASLSVDSKLPVPVGCTVLLESKMKNMERRKMYINGEMKSPDGLQLYATAKNLSIALDFGKEKKVQKQETPKKGEGLSSEQVKSNPNESQETARLYNEMCRQVDESHGLWVVPDVLPRIDKYTHFTQSLDLNGKKLFEFHRILNKTEKYSKGFCQFGPSTMGPEGFVHGGATATALDVITADLSAMCGYRSVTANLSVNYQLPVPAGSTVLLEAKIESAKGGKIYVNGTMKSSDGLQLYATAKTLCV